MSQCYTSSLLRVGCALALVLTLADCTKGGQFDPTTVFDNDMFDTKKKLRGDREPVFPNGVPGTTTGVPADLVKGYEPPPDQPDAAIAAAPAPAAVRPTAVVATKPKPKAKIKPRPKVAVAPAQGQDSVWSQKAAPVAPTRISVGRTAPPAAPVQQQAAPSQSTWPAPPQTAPAQQAAQPSQSIWPNPPAPGTSSQ